MTMDTSRLRFPKPKLQIEDRIAYKREQEAKGRAFRRAVWIRDQAKCQHCGRRVFHMLDALPERGEVHHRRGRNVAPDDRYNVARAMLLCLLCHLLAQRRKITLRWPR